MNELNGNQEQGVSIITGKPVRNALFFESMTEVRCPNTQARIRIWRSEPHLPEYADEELLGIFKAIPGGATMKEMIDIISSFERVTACELTDANGLGCVAYFEW